MKQCCNCTKSKNKFKTESKVYEDSDQCKKDNGDYMRVLEQFISWKAPEPHETMKREIVAKVLGTTEERPN